MESYHHGVSTRQAKKITEGLCGVFFSKSQVSELTKSLDVDLEIWCNRPVRTHYSVLCIGEMYTKIRREPGGQAIRSGGFGVDSGGYSEFPETAVVYEENKTE